MQLESCRRSEFCHSMLQWSKPRWLWLYHMPCFVLTMLTSFSFATGRKKTIPLQTLGGFIYTFSFSFSSSFTCQSSRSNCSSSYSQNSNSNYWMSSVQLSFCCMYLLYHRTGRRKGTTKGVDETQLQLDGLGL